MSSESLLISHFLITIAVGKSSKRSTKTTNAINAFTALFCAEGRHSIIWFQTLIFPKIWQSTHRVSLLSTTFAPLQKAKLCIGCILCSMTFYSATESWHSEYFFIRLLCCYINTLLVKVETCKGVQACFPDSLGNLLATTAILVEKQQQQELLFASRILLVCSRISWPVITRSTKVCLSYYQWMWCTKGTIVLKICIVPIFFWNGFSTHSIRDISNRLLSRKQKIYSTSTQQLFGGL